MNIKNHNKDRKTLVMRKRFSIAAFIAVLACIVLLVSHYFRFVPISIYEESVSRLTDVFHQSDTIFRVL